MQLNPLALYGFFLLFLINPFKTCYYKSRFWLLKLLVTTSTLNQPQPASTSLNQPLLASTNLY